MSTSVDLLSEPKALLKVSEPAIKVSSSSLIIQNIKVLSLPADKRYENHKSSHTLVHANLEQWHRVIFDRYLLYHVVKIVFLLKF